MITRARGAKRLTLGESSDSRLSPYRVRGKPEPECRNLQRDSGTRPQWVDCQNCVPGGCKRLRPRSRRSQPSQCALFASCSSAPSSCPFQRLETFGLLLVGPRGCATAPSAARVPFSALSSRDRCVGVISNLSQAQPHFLNSSPSMMIASFSFGLLCRPSSRLASRRRP